jgi:hypothetical protein
MPLVADLAAVKLEQIALALPDEDSQVDRQQDPFVLDEGLQRARTSVGARAAAHRCLGHYAERI